jgi:small neutral amino acid transporter SnatA (MarC family)
VLSLILPLLAVDGIIRYLSVDTLDVANRVLALLLAALAMATLVNGAEELVRDVVSQLQEASIIGN